MRFVIDECLPQALARLLDRHGRFPVDHVFDHRAPGEGDFGIKAMAAEQGFIVVTRDSTFIPSRTIQRTYLDEKLSCVILTAALAEAGRNELEAWLLKHWARIEDTFDGAPRPTVVRAYRDGRLDVESEARDE
ncbi:MAG: DUF5615 family PIN-like protein [Armatimonadota bacterium]|nr:DUF5615 family PIN-like protein [Armatimonadota bacterium]